MIGRLVSWCTCHSRLVLLATLVLAAAGEWGRRALSRDAVPDLSGPQIGLIVEWTGHPATEVAARVTQKLTESLKSVPGATSVRGSSMAGMAYLNVLLGTPADLDPGRAEIERRVSALRPLLPPAARAQIGPPASATGWIYQYAIVGSSGRPLAVSRSLHDELIRPELESIPGVAEVASVGDMPVGITDLNGGTTAAGGIVVARRDADPKKIILEVERRLHDVEKRLVPRVKILTVYSRLDLADRVERTLLRALVEEIIVLVSVVLIFLLHVRSALVPLATLPLVVLLTFAGMRLLGIPVTIMSLSGIGIALGMAVDLDVVALEACHRRIEHSDKATSRNGRRAALLEAAGTIAPAVLTSLLITALSFLPVLAFSGEAGRLLRPLAMTKTLVIFSAAVVAVTVAPALRDGLLRGPVLPEFENPITKGLLRIYRPFVQLALSRPALALVTAALAVASCVPILGRLGGEFLPRVDEGDLLLMPAALPGITGGDTGVQLRRIDGLLMQFPEIRTVFGKAGRANTATDPAPSSMLETILRLRPRSEWPKVVCPRWYSGWAPAWLKRALGLLWPEERPETTTELLEKLDGATRMPGWTNAWTAPARARMDMMATGGVRTPVGIRIVAADSARLDLTGAALQQWATRRPGTRSALFESPRAGPRLELDPAAIATLRSENGELVAYVYIDLAEGTDVASYVSRAQRDLSWAVGMGEIRLEPGERIEWTGQYQLLTAGEQRLKWIAPLVAISMLGLLFLQFRSITQALIVLVAVPFALVGSLWSLFLLHYPLSAPVWVGLLSAVGMAMQTGVVTVVYIDEAFHRRVREGRIQSRADIIAAHAEGTVLRLRPKIMTVTTMAAGLLPLLWADGSGAEIMKCTAAPMLGGVATSAFFTLGVLPVIYTIWRASQLRQGQRLGKGIDAVVPAVPPWAGG